MKDVLIVGGSRGIGKALLEKQITKNRVVNLSRTAPGLTHTNLTHFNIDILGYPP